MPRGDEEGAVVIGGWQANSASTAYVDIGIAVALVNLRDRNADWEREAGAEQFDGFVDGDADKPYVLQVNEWGYKDVEVSGPHKDQTGNVGKGRFLIDSLSPVIRTDEDHAAKVAAQFEPVAVQGRVIRITMLTATANSGSGTGISLKLVGGKESAPSKWFPIANVDLIVKMPRRKCISTFQPVLEGKVMRLGWAFLKNAVVEGTVISVWARVPPAL